MTCFRMVSGLCWVNPALEIGLKNFNPVWQREVSLAWCQTWLYLTLQASSSTAHKNQVLRAGNGCVLEGPEGDELSVPPEPRHKDRTCP